METQKPGMVSAEEDIPCKGRALGLILGTLPPNPKHGRMVAKGQQGLMVSGTAGSAGDWPRAPIMWRTHTTLWALLFSLPKTLKLVTRQASGHWRALQTIVRRPVTGQALAAKPQSCPMGYFLSNPAHQLNPETAKFSHFTSTVYACPDYSVLIHSENMFLAIRTMHQ